MSKELNYPLKPVQLKYLKKIAKHHYVIVGAKQGSGKTLVAIRTTLGKRAIVLCPASLKYTWEAEYKEFCKVPPRILRVDSSNAHRIEELGWDVLICSYTFFKKIKDKKFGKVDVFVMDEHHLLLNPKSGRSKAVLQVVSRLKPKYCLQMSGTPNKGKGQQWYMPLLLSSMNPSDTNGQKLPEDLFTYWDFQHKFCNIQKFKINGREITQFEGIRNVPLLKTLLNDKLFRFKPPKIDAELLFKSVYMEETKLSKEVDTELLKNLEAGDDISEHTMSMKAQSALAKANFTVQYVKDLMESVNTPIVIFTDHRDSQSKILEGLDKKNFKKINGSTPLKQRHEIVKALQAGNIDGIVSTITSMNTGHTMTAAKDMIMSDRNWDYVENDQAYYRIYRIGQTGDCTVHQIFGSEMDKKILKNIEKRKKIINKVMGDE